MDNKNIICILLASIWLISCGAQSPSTEPNEVITETPTTDNSEKTPNNGVAIISGAGGSLASQNDSQIHFTIDTDDQHQTIESFGASDAWSIQYVGNWNFAPAIAELLFSTELDNKHNPKGIGLSLWRFNLGAGSSEQNNITDQWRRSETFLKKDGDYDWSKQKGQQNFLQLAKKSGVKKFVAFSNSPPIHLTKNGNAFGDGGKTSNLPNENISAFSKFLVDVWSYFNDPSGPGITFSYISPVNEPQWDWAQGNGQEGNPYTNKEISTLVKSLDNEINQSGIDTKIELPEAAQLNFFYQNRDQRGNQLSAFFNPSSDSQVGHLNNVSPKISGHSYFTTWPVSTLIDTRKELAQKMQDYPNLKFWMSEYCNLEDNNEVTGTSDVGGLNPALYTARVIHHDLTIANASSWQWWLAVSPYNYNDGLVYVGRSESENYQESKTLWALGQYSRFIRPGMKRIGTYRNDQMSLERQAESIMVSAYIDNETDRVVLVIINYSNSESTISTELSGLHLSNTSWVPYITNASEDMTAYEAIGLNETIKIPARSIVTLATETEE